MLPPKCVRKFLPISQITRDPLTQMRDGKPDDEYLSQLQSHIQSGGKLAPCEVVSDGRHNWLTDGWVRVGILETMEGIGGVECDVYPGTLLDARYRALGANSRHGRNRTPEDIRKAVYALIDSPELVEKVGKRHAGIGGLHGGIAAACNISIRTVDRILEERGLHVHMGKLATRPTPVRSDFGTNNMPRHVTPTATRVTPPPQFKTLREADEFGAYFLGEMEKKAVARGDHSQAEILRRAREVAEEELDDDDPPRDRIHANVLGQLEREYAESGDYETAAEYQQERKQLEKELRGEVAPKAPPLPPETPEELADKSAFRAGLLVGEIHKELAKLIAGPRRKRLLEAAKRRSSPIDPDDPGAWAPLALVGAVLAAAKR